MDDYDLRPVQNDAGTWDALTADGYGHTLGYNDEWDVVVWLDGYDTGARENM